MIAGACLFPVVCLVLWWINDGHWLDTR